MVLLCDPSLFMSRPGGSFVCDMLFAPCHSGDFTYSIPPVFFSSKASNK